MKRASKCNKMKTIQDLPDELVLKILKYSEIKDLISCGQVSKRTRRISHDGTLWVSANLEKKVVKTELLEMILGKGCRILNLCDSTILGSLSSNMKSQLRVLNLSRPVQAGSSTDTIEILEVLLSSSCSLQHLVMEGVFLSHKMVVGICKNGKTLQRLNLNFSDLPILQKASSYPFTIPHYLQEIIKWCQELKEVDLAHMNLNRGLKDDDLKFLVKNIPPNVEKLNLSGSRLFDNHVKILLARCNKIKAFSLEATWITDKSLKNIGQYLNLTLEELSLGRFFLLHSIDVSLTGFFALESMPRLKILNVYYEKNDKEIQNLRQHLPHLTISGLK